MSGAYLVAAVSLLHPALAAAGLLAGGIPVVIHLINRRRHKRVPWAAMTFLHAAIRRRAKRLRLEQWLLLMVRALVLMFLGLALARPFLSASRFLPVGQSRAHRVLLVDNSASMGAVGRSGSSVFEDARRAAGALLDSFPESDAVSLIALAAPSAAVVEDASFDRREVRSRLSALPLTQRPTDLSGAFRHAEEVLKSSPAAPGNRTVYLLSDMAATAWSPQGDVKTSAQTAAARRLAERESLVMVPVGGEFRANVGVLRLEVGPGAVAAKAPVRFAAEVVNFGADTVRDAVLQIRRGERIERRIALPRLSPGQKESVNFLMEFDAAGSYALSAHVETTAPDALALDNNRYLSINVAPSVPVLVVGGTQGGTGVSAETGYLVTALNPWTESKGSGLISPKAISDLEIAGEVLGDYRAVVLCNVGRLEEEVWRRLQRFVEEGGGLLVFAGEAVNVEHYNRLGFTAGQGVLPGLLGAPVGEAGGREGLAFKEEEFGHPAMAEFTAAAGSGLFLARVEKYLPINIEGTTSETLLQYSNGLPAIALCRRGAGRSCFVTTTANMAWNNLPAKGDYVSLIMDLVSYLSHPPDRRLNLQVGETIARALSAGEASLPLRVQLPSGEMVEAAISVVAGPSSGDEKRFSMFYKETDQVGIYRTFVGEKAAGGHGGAEGVAVNSASEESDLRPIDDAEVSAAIQAPLTWAKSPAELSAKAGASLVREIGSQALYLVLALLLIETWLATRFGSKR